MKLGITLAINALRDIGGGIVAAFTIDRTITRIDSTAFTIDKTIL